MHMDEVVLGFDYGTKRIGVAVGQTVSGTAAPLTTVGMRRNKPEWDRITRLIDEWQPQRLLVGVPLNMRRQRQRMTDACLRFSRQLTARYRLPVETVDECLSSRAAREYRPGRQPVDSLAATLIVETWLRDGGMVV